MKGVSRNALRALEADGVETADLRPAQIARLQHVSGEVLDTIQEVFAGTSLPEDQGRVGEVLQARRAVNEAWDKARANFVEIGRALNALDARLVSKEERAALRRGLADCSRFPSPLLTNSELSPSSSTVGGCRWTNAPAATAPRIRLPC